MCSGSFLSEKRIGYIKRSRRYLAAIRNFVTVWNFLFPYRHNGLHSNRYSAARPFPNLNDNGFIYIAIIRPHPNPKKTVLWKCRKVKRIVAARPVFGLYDRSGNASSPMSVINIQNNLIILCTHTHPFASIRGRLSRRRHSSCCLPSA